MQVEGDLVVAAAARVQLERDIADDLAQTPLDGRVHVLVRQRPREPPRLNFLQHRPQTPYQLPGLLVGHYPGLAEHPGVSDRALYIVRSEPDVEGDGGVQPLECVRWGGREPAAPEWSRVSLAHGYAV